MPLLTSGDGNAGRLARGLRTTAAIVGIMKASAPHTIFDCSRLPQESSSFLQTPRTGEGLIVTNPYENLPGNAFWRLAIGQRSPIGISDLWAPKHPLAKSDKVVTVGSCFAQHIGRALSRAGYSWYDAEPAPAGLPEDLQRKFNYGIFSFRTGNIYTVALLLQWLRWAAGEADPPTEIWVERERYYDPFRPIIEPEGFASEIELLAARRTTLAAIRQAVTDCDLFVLTLGLTESWLNKEGGHVYPTCPGTVAGTFDLAKHAFHNYRYPDIRRDLETALELMRSLNPDIRFLLTVSPVPLTATASPQHVLVATIQSKSTLRTVAGDLAADRTDTDYFPSYEMISGFPFKGVFYEPNMRTVSPDGVDFVMNAFFAGLNDGPAVSMAEAPAVSAMPAVTAPRNNDDDLVCEEILLDAFGPAA